MSLQDTPSGERVHIGLFGRRNAGKSSLLNGITGQSVAIVSEEKGTTTDPVKKAMELLPVGPVLWIDTPGLDDDSTLGGKRVEKTRQWWQTVDMALLVLDGSSRDFSREKELLAELRQAHKPYGILVNKEDQMQDEDKDFFRQAFPEEDIVFTCAKKPEAMEQLRDVLTKKCYETLSGEKRELLPDWISPKKPVVLVVPVDSAAPKGRLILPQQMVLRAVLDKGAYSIVTKETELKEVLETMGEKPQLVITDSQAFSYVSSIVSEAVPLTSFSILMARYKGDLKRQVEGADVLDRLEEGAKILISEGCSHHRQCDDIGTVKLPSWIRNYTGKNFHFSFTSGGEFPSQPEADLIIHCGGCTLHEKEMKRRIRQAGESGIPMTNYGILIAKMNGILARSLSPFTDKPCQ